jgi:hypothetical protein
MSYKRQVSRIRGIEVSMVKTDVEGFDGARFQGEKQGN